MNRLVSMLVTSEMMEDGIVPLLFTGGACNIQGINGPIRNPGRDLLAQWLDQNSWSYFDPQIHSSTHGRDYVWGIDGPQEKKARELAKLRVYEITPTTIAAITILEIMDDMRCHRRSIIWFNKGNFFSPIGLGERDQLQQNTRLRTQVGEMVFQHLLAYINAGRQLRNELVSMLQHDHNAIFAYTLDEVKAAITAILSR
ncbi:hypothetical protein [Thioflexithrix psekupsensis]|nr:hypothetical protein [Thioflexithrix psekupsensis]